MQKELQIRVLPEVAGQSHLLEEYIIDKEGLAPEDLRYVEILRSSIDARAKQAYYNLKVRLYIGEEYSSEEITLPDYPDVSSAREVIVIGSGPAGLFAALELMEKGLKPIILERGKNAKDRIKDLKAINVRHEVNEDSNYCFGEGGAGTYSDGKLYTRSKKRGNVMKVLERLVGFGAVKDILVDSHPHIGTNKLPGIIANMRECIIQCGGEIHFNTRVTDLNH
ncbi:MAG: FAD-binding protein [Gracilimonas sp.]|nr:FAD-binding protein [Gracilimonas sp.]